MDVPFSLAYGVYQKLHGDRAASKFAMALFWFTKHGYVYCTPDTILLFYAAKCGSEWPPPEQINPNPDTWYVHLAAGRNAPLVFTQVVPYELPYISWARVLKENSVLARPFDKVVKTIIKTSV